MTISQLVRKTGASRRALSTALDQLVAKDWIQITDPSGSYLHDAIDRRGKSRLIFALTESDESCPLKVPSLDRGQTSRVKFAQQPEQILPTTKETATKGYAKKVRKELEELGILK